MTDRICSIDDCGRTADTSRGGARGWCQTHYMRWVRHGDPLHGGKVVRQHAAGEPCPLDGCGRPTVARGLCERHYRRLRRYGDAAAGRISPGALTDHERFASKVMITETCWLWLDAPNNAGYGTFKADGVMWMAHRYAMHIAGKPLSPRLTIDHLCRTRLCVRTDHLEEVTNAENLRRARAAG